MLAGETSALTGGALSLRSGEGTSTTSGHVTIASSNAERMALGPTRVQLRHAARAAQALSVSVRVQRWAVPAARVRVCWWR